MRKVDGEVNYIPFHSVDSQFLGTPLYMSPESVQDDVAEKALDLWSLGCVVLEMYTGEPAWPFADSKDLFPHSLSCDAR